MRAEREKKATARPKRRDEELRTGQQIQKSFMRGMDDPAAYVLPALLYFWQLPHFMSLAWIVRYEINDTGDDTTKFQSFMQYYSHCGSYIYILSSLIH